MPWIDNKYVPSVYTKNELPTWDEIYNQFYLGKYYDPRIGYNTKKWTEYDPYWNIPRWKYLWATTCNQINKTIHEDHKFPQYEDYVLMVSDVDWSKFDTRLPIYHIKHPKGLDEYFVIENPNVRRIDVRDTDFNYFRFLKKDKSYIDLEDDEFDEMLETLMQPYADYFDNGVGWKDLNNVNKTGPIGYDPAL